MQCATMLTVHFSGLLIQSTDWSQTEDELPIPSEVFMPTDKLFGTRYSDDLLASHTPMQYSRKTTTTIHSDTVGMQTMKEKKEPKVPRKQTAPERYLPNVTNIRRFTSGFTEKYHCPLMLSVVVRQLD